jgi:hypothetical protein
LKRKYDANQKSFTLIKRSHIEDDLDNFSYSQKPRDFCGKLLHIIYKDLGHTSPGYISMYQIYKNEEY